jgi:hypothetical protein
MTKDEKMRTIWIHIGSHKTGTTTLQSALKAAGRKDALQGMSYCHPVGKINSNALIDVTGKGEDMRWTLNPLILKRRIPEEGDCIISAERLFWLDDQAEIARIAKILRRRFDRIMVVAYLRRQDLLAVSFRKTTVATQVGRRFFGDRIGAFPEYQPHMDRYFCYAEKLQLWENVFGAENVIVRKYDKKHLVGGDTVTDFCSLLGIDSKIAVKEQNTKWNRSQLLVGMWLQARNHDCKDVPRIIADIEDDQQLMPARSEAIAFMQRFAASNALLARKYDPEGLPGYFDDDFSRFPEQGNDDLSTLTISLDDIEKRLIQA